MPKMTMRAKLNGGPDVEYSRRVDTLGDLPRFFRGASQQVAQVVKMMPSLKPHKVVSVTVRAE